MDQINSNTFYCVMVLMEVIGAFSIVALIWFIAWVVNDIFKMYMGSK